MAEDRLEPSETLRLDALERDGETLAPRFVLQVDADVKGVDSPDDDTESITAFDDVCVHEPT